MAADRFGEDEMVAWQPDEEHVTVDMYPSSSVAGSRRAVVTSAARVVLDLALTGLAVWLCATGVIPAALDAHGGRWVWLAAGVVAAMALDELVAAVVSLRGAVRFAGQVRRHAREVFARPLAMRLVRMPRSEVPAGLTCVEDVLDAVRGDR